MIQVFVPKDPKSAASRNIGRGAAIVGAPKGAGLLVASVVNGSGRGNFADRVATARRIFDHNRIGCRRVLPAAEFVAVADVDPDGQFQVRGKKAQKTVETWTKKKTSKKEKAAV